MVEIKEVKNKSDLRKFILFPQKLYKDNDYYVPDMVGDEYYLLQKGHNPSLEFCELVMFLAYKDGQIVGRIAAFLNPRANEKFNNKRVRFTRVDFIDDFEVSSALFKAAEDWARSKGMNEIHGPIGFSDLDKQGMLIEGFDRLSIMPSIYNAEYYQHHLDRLGYRKEADWIECHVKVPESIDPKVQRMSDIILRRTKTRLVTLKSMKEADPYVNSFFTLANECYADLYGQVPLDEAQFQQYADKYLKMMDPRFVYFINDQNDKMIGLAMAMPSLSKALRRVHGRLFPFGWIDLLRAQKKGDTLDMYLVAIHPDYQTSGLAFVLINHMWELAMQYGFKWAETGPMLEENEKVAAIWKMFDKEQDKRRRCYVKAL